jgi:hypothetical protein
MAEEKIKAQWAEEGRAKQDAAFDQDDYRERLTIAKRLVAKGKSPLFKLLLDPVINRPPTLAELRVLVPLKRDRLRYIKYSLNRHGLYALPKPTVKRIKAHWNKAAQAVKSTALPIFRDLFTAAAEELEATCKQEQIEYLGVPESVGPALAEKAQNFARKSLGARYAAHRRRHNRMQSASRRINAGLMNGNQTKRFVNRGHQHGF